MTEATPSFTTIIDRAMEKDGSSVTGSKDTALSTGDSMTHTPGPWERRRHSKTVVCSWKGKYSARRFMPQVIARCDSEENAQLVVAAPDLLNGCKALLGLVTLVCARDDLPPAIRDALQDGHRMEEAIAAIAKATRSPS